MKTAVVIYLDRPEYEFVEQKRPTFDKASGYFRSLVLKEMKKTERKEEKQVESGGDATNATGSKQNKPKNRTRPKQLKPFYVSRKEKEHLDLATRLLIELVQSKLKLRYET